MKSALTSLVIVAIGVGLVVPTQSYAMCCMMVAPQRPPGEAPAVLKNNATMVVMMRDGDRTVLSMQSDYEGPPQNFAMVFPVPVVLQEENVRTLPANLFTRVDRIAAPRLVEFEERNPCPTPMRRRAVALGSLAATGGAPMAESMDAAAPAPPPVVVEEQFAVGEYDIVILSATDSSALQQWLQQNNYATPPGVEAELRPYIQSGSKFFVARVNIERANMQNGRLVLSPLRVHFDSPEFSLPIRLGLLNSAGSQDLIVHILARGTRYEVANYRNAIMPTNIRIRENAKARFGDFYEALYRKTRQHRRRYPVVTEYAYLAQTCESCTTRPLQDNELQQLGADVMAPRQVRTAADQWVLTRLHHRYTRRSLRRDLVFRTARPIEGGVGEPSRRGALRQRVRRRGVTQNRYIARYAVVKRWRGALTCRNPQRGRWVTPNEQMGQQGRGAVMPATNQSFRRARNLELTRYVTRSIPSIGLRLRSARTPTSR